MHQSCEPSKQVFDSVGDDLSFYNGVLTGSPSAIDLFKARIGEVAYAQSPSAYVNRDGSLHLPFGDALHFARAFCAIEPAAALLTIETTERQRQQDARRGNDHILPLLNAIAPHGPSFVNGPGTTRPLRRGRLKSSA